MVRCNEVLRNAILKQHHSVADFCREHQLYQQKVGELISLKASPCTQDGVWRIIVLKIVGALKMLPEDLFPRELYTQLGDWDSGEIEFVSFYEITTIHASSTPLDVVLNSEIRQVLYSVLGTLTLREQNILVMREIDGMTLQSIAHEIHVTRERVRQLCSRALRKLRQPARLRLLQEVV